MPPAGWIVVLLAVATTAMPAQAQIASDEDADVGPDDPAQTQQPSQDTTDEDADTGPDDAAEVPPSSPETEGEPGPEDEEVGPIGAKVTAADDVLRQIHETKAKPFEDHPLDYLYSYWREFNDKLDEGIGLRLGFTYFALFQYTTPGPDPREAASGDFDFFGRWALLEGKDGSRGVFGFNLEHRHAYTDIPPSELNQSIGSAWRTTRGFTDSGFSFNELWWDQRLANDRISFRIGTINQKHFYDLHKFKSQKWFFLATPYSDSPTMAFPRNGIGAVLRVSPLEELHITAGFGDANGKRRVGGFDTFFGDAEFFTAVDVAFTPTFDGLGDGRYSVTAWHTDATSDRGRPSGRGFSALISQEIVEGVVPFARYGYGDGADLLIEHLVAVGVGIQGPFGRKDDVAGLGASWARPPVDDPREQWGVEAFYRFQLTPRIQVTPGVQLIINPSADPDEDVVGIFQLRLGLVF